MTGCHVGIVVLEEDVVFVKEGDSVLVVETLEWSGRCLEARVELLDKLAGDGVSKDHVHDFTDLKRRQRMKAERQGK